MKMLTKILCGSALAMTSVAFAGPDISITNNTDETISLAAVQLSACSQGIPAHHTITMPSKNVATLCRRFEHDCIGDFFATDDCTGNAIARVHVDVEKGVYDVKQMQDYPVSITADHIIIDKK